MQTNGSIKRLETEQLWALCPSAESDWNWNCAAKFLRVIEDTQIVMQTGCKDHVGIIFLGNKANNLIAWVENDIREAGFGFLILRLSLCIAINNVADRQF